MNLMSIKSPVSFQGSPTNSLDSPGSPTARLLSPEKWKKYMISVLDQMSPNQDLLITDLITIVMAIPETSFIEAALQISPFKPQFVDSYPLLHEDSVTTATEAPIKVAHFRQEEKNKQQLKKQHRIRESTLTKQLNRSQHPFSFIIKNFKRLLQLKFKSLIDGKKIEMKLIFKELQRDLKIFTNFLQSAALPYQKLFMLDSEQEKTAIIQKLADFMEVYVSEHPQLRASLKKILLYACRAQYQPILAENLQDFVQPDDFQIPEEYKISGCFFMAIDSLMSFSEGSDPEAILEKLIEFRTSILQDIDEYYLEETGESKDLQVCAEVQIEIIRFILAKLKGWSAQILAQLKFLQLTLGEEEIAYKFDSASFIYAQLTLAYEIAGIN